jgi:hypothetical protein
MRSHSLGTKRSGTETLTALPCNNASSTRRTWKLTNIRTFLHWIEPTQARDVHRGWKPAAAAPRSLKKESTAPRWPIKKVTAPRCFIKISYRPAAATIFSKTYRYRAAAAMVFKKFFRISLLRLYRTGNIGTSPLDSCSLRIFHL